MRLITSQESVDSFRILATLLTPTRRAPHLRSLTGPLTTRYHNTPPATPLAYVPPLPASPPTAPGPWPAC